MTHTTRTLLVIAVTALGTATGCSKDEPESTGTTYAQPAASQGDEATPSEPTAADMPGVTGQPPTPVAPMVSPNTPPPGASLSDGQIAKVTDAIDTAEINQAQLATTRASNPAVKRFAAHMIEEHSRAKQEAAQLVAASHITLASSDDSNELEGKAAKTLERLSGASASEFDKEYIKAQVEQHQAVLASVTSKLIPSSTNSELRTQLAKMKALVEKHLAEAKELQRSL